MKIFEGTVVYKYQDGRHDLILFKSMTEAQHWVALQKKKHPLGVLDASNKDTVYDYLLKGSTVTILDDDSEGFV